jgi:hypothetical protein
MSRTMIFVPDLGVENPRPGYRVNKEGPLQRPLVSKILSSQARLLLTIIRADFVMFPYNE